MSSTMKFAVVAGAALSVSASALAADDAVRAQAAELMANANAQTSALQDGGTGPRVGGFTQFRYNWNYRRDDGIKKSAIGFQNARTVLSVSGNLNPQWGYYVDGGFSDGTGSSGDGSFVLRDAYGTYKMDNGWTILWGQAKAPVLREELVGDTTQLAAERSTFNSFFTGGRTQGVIANYTGDSFRFWGAFTDGARTANNDFTSSNESDYSLTARGEWKWDGSWEQANDFTSFQNAPYFGMVGGAIHFQDGGSTFGTSGGRTNDASVLLLTADVSVEGNGWNVFAAAAWRNVDPAVGSKLDDYGLSVQGGVFVQAQWELFGRFEWIRRDSDYGAGERNFTALTLGVNHYFVPESHAAKLTVDWQYFFNKTSTNPPIPTSTVGGLLGSDKRGEWNLRGQMQLVF